MADFCMNPILKPEDLRDKSLVSSQNIPKNLHFLSPDKYTQHLRMYYVISTRITAGSKQPKVLPKIVYQNGISNFVEMFVSVVFTKLTGS